jgi:GNAT superfamily N-acetyltransferase
MQIESIADHLHLVETIATWHFQEWGHADPQSSVKSWTEGLRHRTNRTLIPTTYVALHGSELLGTVTLVENDMCTHMDLMPWLAGLYVKPSMRGKGIGSALTQHAVYSAARMGVNCLYLYTESARDMYEKLGWRPIAKEVYKGQLVTIMSFELQRMAIL